MAMKYVTSDFLQRRLGPTIYCDHYTTSINCCKKPFSFNDSKIMEFEMIDNINCSAAYVVIYKMIT